MRRTSLAATALWPIPMLVVAWVVMMLALGQCAPIGSIPEEAPEPSPIVEESDTLYTIDEVAPTEAQEDGVYYYSPPYMPRETIGPFYMFPGRVSIPRPE